MMSSWRHRFVQTDWNLNSHLCDRWTRRNSEDGNFGFDRNRKRGLRTPFGGNLHGNFRWYWKIIIDSFAQPLSGLATEDLNYCEYVLKLLDRLKGSSKDSMTLEHFRLLEFEIKVRMALLEDNVDKAIRMCTNRIHLFPSEIGPRKLLAKILLRKVFSLCDWSLILTN